MGHGLDPAPTNDLGTGIVIDDGTSPRTEVPTPGPVGMDSGGGSSNKSHGQHRAGGHGLRDPAHGHTAR